MSKPPPPRTDTTYDRQSTAAWLDGLNPRAPHADLVSQEIRERQGAINSYLTDLDRGGRKSLADSYRRKLERIREKSDHLVSGVRSFHRAHSRYTARAAPEIPDTKVWARRLLYVGLAFALVGLATLGYHTYTLLVSWAEEAEKARSQDPYNLEHVIGLD